MRFPYLSIAIDLPEIRSVADLNVPSFQINESQLETYTVQRGEDMRIDLVMKSIYDDIYLMVYIYTLWYIFLPWSISHYTTNSTI